jgi:hypothetical protein
MSDRFRLLAKKIGGRLIFDSPVHLQGVLAALPERISVTLERERVIRTSQQNRYYHSCIVPIVQEVLSVGRDLPLSRDQTHELLKQAFLGFEDTKLGRVGKSTRELDTKQFTKYCDDIQSHFVTEFGIAFPRPGEPEVA